VSRAVVSGDISTASSRFCVNKTRATSHATARDSRDQDSFALDQAQRRAIVACIRIHDHSTIKHRIALDRHLVRAVIVTVPAALVACGS